MNKRKIACHECDLLMLVPELQNKQKAICPRCGFVITKYFRQGHEKLLAFSLTALIFLVFSLMFPFITFSAHGQQRVLSLYQSIQSLGEDQYLMVSTMLFFSAILIPMIFLLGIVYVQWSFDRKTLFPATAAILKFTLLLLPWNMAEIFLLAVLVSMIKVLTLAQITFGLSFYFYVFFILTLSASHYYLDRYQLWSHYQRKIGPHYAS
jgi:paraquat-inducible protein A